MPAPDTLTAEERQRYWQLWESTMHEPDGRKLLKMVADAAFESFLAINWMGDQLRAKGLTEEAVFTEGLKLHSAITRWMDPWPAVIAAAEAVQRK